MIFVYGNALVQCINLSVTMVEVVVVHEYGIMLFAHTSMLYARYHSPPQSTDLSNEHYKSMSPMPQKQIAMYYGGRRLRFVRAM
jgi:hypothetical protein